MAEPNKPSTENQKNLGIETNPKQATPGTLGQSYSAGQSSQAARPAKDYASGEYNRQQPSSSESYLGQAVDKGNEYLNQAVEKGGEYYEQAKEVASDAYDKASKTVNRTYEQAVDYGRSNPGKTTLIAFGAGIGIGLILANNYSPRSRGRRFVPPIMNALSEIADEFFR